MTFETWKIVFCYILYISVFSYFFVYLFNKKKYNELFAHFLYDFRTENWRLVEKCNPEWFFTLSIFKDGGINDKLKNTIRFKKKIEIPSIEPMVKKQKKKDLKSWKCQGSENLFLSLPVSHFDWLKRINKLLPSWKKRKEIPRQKKREKSLLLFSLAILDYTRVAQERKRKENEQIEWIMKLLFEKAKKKKRKTQRKNDGTKKSYKRLSTTAIVCLNLNRD